MKKTSRTVVEWGMELYHEGAAVYVPEDLLVQLSERDRYASEFGAPAPLVTPAQGAALVSYGLAVRETRGGYHGTNKLRDLLNEWGW